VNAAALAFHLQKVVAYDIIRSTHHSLENKPQAATKHPLLHVLDIKITRIKRPRQRHSVSNNCAACIGIYQADHSLQFKTHVAEFCPLIDALWVSFRLVNQHAEPELRQRSSCSKKDAAYDGMYTWSYSLQHKPRAAGFHPLLDGLENNFDLIRKFTR
jgi:hypothetical protein